MFARLQKLLSKLVPNTVSHRWNAYKIVSAFTAIALVVALVPLPRNLPSLFAAVPGGVELGDIVVDDNGDDGTEVIANCNVEDNDSSDADGGCRIRDAIALADESNTPDKNRIVFGESITTIGLVETLTIDDDDELVIKGNGVDDENLTVILDGSGIDSGPVDSACTNTGESGNTDPILDIRSSGVTIDSLSIVNAPGNGIQVVNTSTGALSYTNILNNWIGTTDRITNPESASGSVEGNGLHGICVNAVTQYIGNTGIFGNIIVASGNDGIRLEGTYNGQTGTRLPVHQSSIYNNLIGNLTGEDANSTDVSFWPGNRYSGITARIADEFFIHRNIITNNGFRSNYNEEVTPTSDGITLLEANNSIISENYIGTTQDFDAQINRVFPWTFDNGGLDSYGNFNIASIHPLTSVDSDYLEAPNACDGIAVRFYDHLNAYTAGGYPIADTIMCHDDDDTLLNKLNNDPDDFFDASSIGPSVANKIFDNDIGYNLRNGVFIQSLACRPQLTGDIFPDFPNLPNVLTGSGGSLYYVQSAQNSILQNTIFRNDGTDNNGQEPIEPATGPGTYGIGIDLEDYATASFFGDFSPLDNYWVQHFDDPQDDLVNCNPQQTTPINLPGVQPKQPASVQVDYNITENDDYNTLTGGPARDTDPGFDPDAGANRLTNFPVISETGSTSTNITGIAPEGTLVELFQVICTTGTTDDDVPTATGAIREMCDDDMWNDGNDINQPPNDVHTKGHGQGFRFLGNAYVPVNVDADYQGEFHIDPRQFVDGTFHDVAPFNGGLVTATATALVTIDTGDPISQKLCWDLGDSDPRECDTQHDPMIAPAGVGSVSAQRAGSTGTGGLWLPEGYLDCSTGEPSDTNFYWDNPATMQCFGSTSEFSANAVIPAAPGGYTLQKTQSSNEGSQGSALTYVITLTNTGSTTITVGTGALSDTLPSQVTLDSCTWTKTGSGSVGLPPSGSNCPGSALPDIMSMTNFGTLGPGASLRVTVVVHVNDNLDENSCTFNNTVVAHSDMILDENDEEVSGLESATVGPFTVSDCGQTGSGSTLEKQVSVSDGSFSFQDADAPGADAPDANRGDGVSYLIHYGNQTGSIASAYISDEFPGSLSLSPDLIVACWTNNIALDQEAHIGDTDIDCGYSSPDFDADQSTPAIDPFRVPNGDYIHILVRGYYSVFINHPFPGGSIRNTATVTVEETEEFLSDDAYIDILDPAMVVYKSVTVNGSSETSVDAPGPGPDVPAGGDVTYYLDVTNTSSGSVLNDVKLFDGFPVGLGATGWTCQYGIAIDGLTTHDATTYTEFCAVNTLTGEIDGGLPPPEGLHLYGSEVLHVRLTDKNIPAGASGVLCNVVKVETSNDVSPQSTFGDSACIHIQESGQPGLALTKVVDDATPSPGDTVTYTMTVSNPGTEPATNVTIYDDLDDPSVGTPLITTCVSGMANITTPDGVPDNATNSITWNIGTLNPGESRSVHMTVLLRADITSAVNCRNIAVAGSDADKVVAEAEIDIVPTSGGDVSFEKEAINDNGGSDDPDVFELGDTVKYQVTIKNTGSSSAIRLTLKDPIPEEEEDLRSVVATSGNVDATELSNDRLQVDELNVAAGDSETVNYDVSILDDNDFPLENYDLDSDADPEDEDFYPVDVEDDDIGTNSNYDDPEDALDAPDDKFVSLGADGEVILRTSDEDDNQGKLIVDGSGDDFCVMEVDPSVDSDDTTEEYEVEVSQTSDNSDFESVGRSTQNSDCFDLGDADLTWARFVRIYETSSHVSGNAPGSDIDAVCLLNLGGFVTNTASLYSDTALLGTREETVLVNFTDAFDDPLAEKDCKTVKELRIPASPLPLPPVPKQQQVYYPPIQLPTTGAEAAAIPCVLSIMGIIGWVAKRKKF